MKRPKSSQWIVRDEKGRIYGPLAADDVLSQIDRGYFQGREHVALHPGGDWLAISKAPLFADRLLDALVNEANLSRAGASAGAQSNRSGSPSEAAQSNLRPTSDEDSVTDVPVKPATGPGIAGPGTGHTVSGSQSSFSTEAESSVASFGQRISGEAIIELADLQALERQEKFRSLRLPLMLIVAALTLALAALFWPNEKQDSDRIHLLTLRKGQPVLSEKTIVEKFKKAVATLQHDTFSGYMKAQNELVEAIEAMPRRAEYLRRKAEMLSTLCVVYRELWPFAFQDSGDMKAVSLAMQEAKRVDPGGLHGAICEVVQLLLDGGYQDARTLTESRLVEEGQAPVLFEIRGDLYAYVKDYQNAANYFSQARILWPAWQKLAIQEARAQTEMKRFPRAMELYREVLRQVPQHAVAKVELGYLEAIQFNQLEKGYQLIDAGLSGSEKTSQAVQGLAFFGLAQIFEKRDQPQKALEFAKKAYALNSANQIAKAMIVRLAGEKALEATRFETREMLYLGDQYVRAGDCYAAQAQYKAAFDSDKQNGVAAMKAGKCLWQLNQTVEAIEWMKKAIQADPDLIPAYVELADYFAQRFDYQSAFLILKKAQNASPKSYEVYRGFAVVELRRNSFQGAVNFGQQALRLYESDIDTNLILSRAHLGLQQYSEAQRYARRASELDFNNVEAQTLIGKAEAGLYGVAAGAEYFIKLINQIIIMQGRQIPPAAIDYRIALAEIYMQDERYPQAEETLRQAVSLDADHKKALLLLGRALQEQNRPSEALELVLRAAVLDPSDADPVFFSGQIYADVGKFQEAIRQFERVIKINPRHPRAHVNLGRAAMQLGDLRRALAEAMEERAVNPDLADSYLLAGEAYAQLKQYSNCAQEYQKAVAKRAQGALLYVRMARCYRLAGALDSAQSLLRQAEALESGNPDLYKEQGAIYHVKGMVAEAVTAYDTYLKLAPNAMDRPEVEARIQKVQAGDLMVTD